MTTEELSQLLSVHGLAARIKRDEVAIQVCLFCGNEKYNLELNPSRGVYHAWCCGARGRVQSFLREQLKVDRNVPVNIEMREINHRGIFPQPATFTKTIESDWAWEYLKSRRLDVVDVAIYDIGQGFGDVWEGRIVLPLFHYWTHEAVGAIGRAALPGVSPKYYASWHEAKTVAGLTRSSNIHVLVEGMFDGIAVHKAGYNAAILGGVHEKDVEEWAARVPPAHYVAVMLDGDAADLSMKLFWRIVPIHSNTFHIPLPPELDPAQFEPKVIQKLIGRYG